MSERQLAYALIIIGILIALGSLLADSIGIGSAEGIGTYQIIVAVVGAVLALIGLYLAYFRRRPVRDL